MRTKDFIYHHLFGMKTKRLARTERNDMERVRKGNKLEQNKHEFRPQIGTNKENNAQEYARI